ncbi:hypothetical protein WAI453_012610 [Rhynchosporium graminicola]
MHVRSLLITLLLATTGTAEDSKSHSVQSQCQQIRKLEWIVSLASNMTELQELTRNNTAKITEIQADASAASSKLTTLRSNATIVSECAVINAASEQEDQCFETFELQSFIAFAGNATAVAEKTGNNATRIAAIQGRVSDASSQLKTLMSNSTLQAACPAILQKEECKSVMRIENFISKAGNQTVLDQVTKGNSTLVNEIKEEVKKAEKQLEDVRGNKTFVDACMKMGIDLGKGKGMISAAATNQTATSGKSVAVGVKVGRVQVVMLSTILVVAAGMFML